MSLGISAFSRFCVPARGSNVLTIIEALERAGHVMLRQLTAAMQAKKPHNRRG
jgi:hypothetical protein